MKRVTFLSLLLVWGLGLQAQVPDGEPVLTEDPGKFNMVPKLMPFQGRLADGDGKAVNGALSITFSLYNADSGGAALWSEMQTVQVTDGLFQVKLGEVTPLNPSLFSGEDRWLGLKVGSDAEMTPRTRLGSVAYAQKAAAFELPLFQEASATGSLFTLFNPVSTGSSTVIHATRGLPTGFFPSGGTAIFGDSYHGNGVAGFTVTGSGLRGFAHAETGVNTGVTGVAKGDEGRGVVGSANSPTGVTYGVLGSVQSPEGYAGYFAGPPGSRNYFAQKLGIGTHEPAALLHVAGDGQGEGNVLFSGAVKESPGLPAAQGPGTRMMWHPDKAAYRIGRVTEGQWDMEQIGVSSAAWGINTVASGYASTAWGNNNIASGYLSTAFGLETVASGYASQAWGHTTEANAHYSTAWGQNTKATGHYTTAWGRDTEATSIYATAWGLNTLASGSQSTAWGQGTVASGYRATAWGWNTTASGWFSTTSGVETVAPSGYETVIGRYNSLYNPVSLSGWDNADRLFVIGNGITLERRNALTVLKNGNTGIGVDNPTAPLHVKPGNWNLESTDGDILVGDDNHKLKISMSSGGAGAGIARINSMSNGAAQSVRLGAGAMDVLIVRDGVVGINNTSPRQELSVGAFLDLYSGSVNNPTRPSIRASSLNNLIISPYDTGNLYLNYDGGSGETRFHNGSSATELMRLTGAGNLGVGTNNPTERLDVSGNARFRSIASGAYAGPVNRSSNGTLTTATSDARLKQDVAPLQQSLQKALLLQGVSFIWIEDPGMGARIGFIAQEVEKVLPELVFTNPVDGLKGVQYAEMSALLLEALREQQHLIERQREELDALRQQVNVQDGRLSALERLLVKE